jgi:HD-GYP domain-containing protein (c-di-GMP phosphodiesterase class II)
LFDEFRIPLFDLVMSMASAMDLVDEELVNHQKHVAYIAFRLAKETGVSVDEQRDIGLAGMLHDIGALSLKERLGELDPEENANRHAAAGHLLLSDIDPLTGTHIASIVQHHHRAWKTDAAGPWGGDVPFGSHVLHLADRIAISIDRKKYILEQVSDIREVIDACPENEFASDLIEAFKKLADQEYFWLDTVSPMIGRILKVRLSLSELTLTLDGLLGLSDVFRRIIDFRSDFTATHSSGVAASAEALAKLYRFSEHDCMMMKIAGYLHDLGKLAVPVEILEKPGSLTKGEFDIIRSHPYFTFRILEPLKAISQIYEWAAFHHERLNGKGYPFHLDSRGLPLGARIMAVADVFTAITEDRPYRDAMDNNKALSILDHMVKTDALDGDVVSMLKRHFNDVIERRVFAQASSTNEYEKFSVLTSPPVPDW